MPLENLKAYNNHSGNSIHSNNPNDSHHGHHLANASGSYHGQQQLQQQHTAFHGNGNGAGHLQNVHKLVQSINVQFSKIFISSGTF